MSILSRAMITGFLIASSSLPAFAWDVVQDWRDPIGGRTYTAAVTTNDAGMSVVIFRDIDEKVRAVYSLPESSFDRIPIEGLVLAIRPGENSVVQIEAETTNSGPVERARSDGRNIRASLWHGGEPSPTRGTLRNMLDSDTLFARFHTDTGGTIDTTWSLDGAAQVIASAVGIDVDATDEAIEWSNVQTDLLISSSNRCGRDFECQGEMTSCMEILKSIEDVARFNLCVETVAP